MSNVPMTRPEEMLIEHKTAYFTSSTFAELDDGRILRHAYAEFTISEDGGITWSEPFQRRDSEGNLVDGHALVKLSGKGVGLVGNLGKPPTPPHGETREQKAKRQAEGRAARVKGTGPYLVFWRSDDGGETWQSPVRIASNGVGSFHNSIVRTSSGRLLMPVEYGIGQRHGFDPSKQPTTGRIVDGQFLGVSGHYFDPLFGAVYSVYSDDEGRTWDRNEDGDLIIMLDWSTTYSYVFEPTLAEAAPGVILMVMRTGLGRLFQAWSYNDGHDVDTASALAVCRQHDAGGDLLAAINRSPAYHLEPRERRGSEARFEQDVHLFRHQQKRRQLVGVLPERGVGARADSGRATPGTTAPPGRDGIPAGDRCARTGRAIHSRGRFLRTMVVPDRHRFRG